MESTVLPPKFVLPVSPNRSSEAEASEGTRVGIVELCVAAAALRRGAPSGAPSRRPLAGARHQRTTVPAAGPEPALVAGFSARSAEQSLGEMRMQNLGVYHFDDGTCPL